MVRDLVSFHSYLTGNHSDFLAEIYRCGLGLDYSPSPNRPGYYTPRIEVLHDSVCLEKDEINTFEEQLRAIISQYRTSKQV